MFPSSHGSPLNVGGDSHKLAPLELHLQYVFGNKPLEISVRLFLKSPERIRWVVFCFLFFLAFRFGGFWGRTAAAPQEPPTSFRNADALEAALRHRVFRLPL